MAAQRVRRWASQVGASTEGLDLVSRQEGRNWVDSTRTPNMVVELSLRSIMTLEPHSTGTRAIADASIRFLDDGA